MPSFPPHRHLRVPKVCAAVVADSPAAMIEKATIAARETSFLEFRLDSLPRPREALTALTGFLSAHTELTALATCRRKPNGGLYAGSETNQMVILREAARSGFHLVDVEIETAESLGREAVVALRASGAGHGPALVLSWHDFQQTPDLDAILTRMQPFAPDFYKVVSTASCLADNLTLLQFVERVADSVSVVGICMGEAGVLSRVLGPRAGSAFTFAAAVPGEATGPGQFTARTLLETFRIEDVDASTKVFGVAGDPVSGSLSPLMLNAAFRRETVNALYLPLPTASVDDLLTVVRGIPLAGVSVTMPHKQSILKLLDHVDPLTARIGACNTVLRVAGSRGQPAQLYGFNTDVAGVLAPLGKRITLRGARILVLGAGGAARAAVFGLADRGAQVHIVNRTPERAAELAREAGATTARRETLADSPWDAIVNATSVGMASQSASELLTEADFAAGLTARCVFDLVYNPLETPLLRAARAAGIPTIHGVEMFVHQGARQFELWTGKPAPVDEMQRVVLHALRQREEVDVTAGKDVLTGAPTELDPATRSATPLPPEQVPSKVKALKSAGAAKETAGRVEPKAPSGRARSR